MASTQFQHTQVGTVTPVMKWVVVRESRDPEFVREQVAEGQAVIPANRNHNSLDPMVIGREFATKVNANTGNNETASDLIGELEKLHTAVHYGVDMVVNLSTGSNLDGICEVNVAYSPVPIGTAPVYETVKRIGSPGNITHDLPLGIIERQVEQDVGYITAHVGVLMEHFPLADGWKTDIVPRGGPIPTQWMGGHGEQNPLYIALGDTCDIFVEHGMTFSFSGGPRPGYPTDTDDDTQSAGLGTLGELTRIAWGHGVQVMVEGPSHVPMDQIAENVERQREVCDGVPFYVLGSFVTDVVPGYDHIASAIGATKVGCAGTAVLCYVTPKGRLGLSDRENVREGLAAYRITAYAVNVANDLPGACDWDDMFSEARYKFDWARQFDPVSGPKRARPHHDQTLPDSNYKEAYFCSMCGVEFRSMRIDQDTRETDGEMETIEPATDFDASPVADVDLSPVGVYDTDRAPDEIEIGGATSIPESAHGGD